MSKFVIYTPDHEDYLVSIGGSGQGTDWGNSLENAHLFRVFRQAEAVAKQLVAHMDKHTDPYRIVIREVKEKTQGNWKVKSEIEIHPEPDRDTLYQQHPEMRAERLDQSPSEPDVAPVKYVIFQPAKEDYLAVVESNGDFEKSGWAPLPQDAIAYPDFASAERKAGELVLSKRYELTVCELHQTAQIYWTKPIKDFFPIDNSLN